MKKKTTSYPSQSASHDISIASCEFTMLVSMYGLDGHFLPFSQVALMTTPSGSSKRSSRRGSVLEQGLEIRFGSDYFH